MFLTKIISFVILLSILLFSVSLEAKFRNMDSTRLQSTAGIGVGSYLMDEATLLNPAPLGFFNISSVYYQRSSAKPSEIGGAETSAKSDMDAFIISDAKKSLKGSLSYRKHDNGSDSSKRLAVAIAAPVHKQSSMGLSYNKIRNSYQSGEVEKYNQLTLGVIHAVTEAFSIGLVIVDPLRTKKEETRALVGFQYLYKNFVAVMADIGADYNRNLSATEKYGVALQLTIFSDFYLRFGTFQDKGISESGNGAGIGWLSPKLVLDFAVKNTTVTEDPSKNILAEKIKETSLSLSYRF